ncbi:MAG TPA: hypothetical protein VGC07_03500 [Granulicella sp.]
MRFARLLLVFAALLPQLASAQSAAPAPPPCDGSYNIVRVSEIKPGMMDTFVKAVAAQAAWYKAAGLADEIALFRVVDHAMQKYSETEAMTSHVFPAGPLPESHRDAAFDAFVKLFRDSSTIKTESFTCMNEAVGLR